MYDRYAYELELIGYRIDALPMGSQALQLNLWWRGIRPPTEDWTAFCHLTPSANNAELVGQLDHAITDHEYPPTVWSPGEVVVDSVQLSAAGMAGTRAGSNCRMKRAAVYQRRRPERSVAYQVVQHCLVTWLARQRAGRLDAGADWVVDPVPAYVERDLRKYLE